MVDFGEYSNDVYLVPYEGLVDTSDYDNLETGSISLIDSLSIYLSNYGV